MVTILREADEKLVPEVAKKHGADELSTLVTQVDNSCARIDDGLGLFIDKNAPDLIARFVVGSKESFPVDGAFASADVGVRVVLTVSRSRRG
jgi:hypothetical protein